ncbi:MULTISPECIES: cyclase family protein [unclassified Fusibacter]|uniref:cyclase family protein n=1 Tax=unclassified Fusibacter TaxID=2624464 RepID=UPI001010E3F8|nr:MULTISPECIES: cyclase family protein [unclassified Fusibacter]MCK8060496.1 cyclase family protein [Fusibacter sp. A2]NPE20215.1 cyclase family protein [Fusibacter sp. A1]RXV63424.1 cyclase family protein [Fusibacter sp. A1]
MKLYDITQTIDEHMTVYKNKAEKRPIINVTRTHNVGGVRESSITLDVHTGTHLDAPLHMQADGTTIDTMALEQLITRCKVFDFTHLDRGISKGDLDHHKIEKGDVVLFKTRNSFEDFFNPEFIYLEESGAKYLTGIGIKGVGTDGLGIERAQPGHPTHHTLFNSGVYVLEGLALKDVPVGEYELIALPLKLKGLDASPVRAVLIERD